MPIPIHRYLSIRNDYCFIYLGDNQDKVDSYKIHVENARNEFKDLNINFCVKDKFAQDGMIKQSELSNHEFAGTFTFKDNG